jgi:pantothenate kinase
MQEFPKELCVAELTIDVSGFSKDWKQKVLALGNELDRKYRERKKGRYIVACGGASGSSKSTTTKALEAILRSRGVPAVAVSQDGYHFPQDYLLRTMDGTGRPLSEHKGRYDTFDVPAMKVDLERFRDGLDQSFPHYSRKSHNPVPNAIVTIGPTLLLFEGLWLLYDHAPWNELLPLYDLTILFHASAAMRKSNTIKRHTLGALRTATEAESFYERSDAKNAELILSNVAKHDVNFVFS